VISHAGNRPDGGSEVLLVDMYLKCSDKTSINLSFPRRICHLYIVGKYNIEYCTVHYGFTFLSLQIIK